MLLLLLSYLGGVLTILSPCILPVLPFVFARAGQSFVRSGLPMLVGMASTFALVATLAAIGGGWAVHANQYGRWIAIALLGVFGLTLLIPTLGDRMMGPLVALGNRLSQSTETRGGGGSGTVVPSFMLGIATGLLWAPCAGPILGLVLTGAALNGASVGTSILLVAYGLGAATSLGAALLIGGRVFAALKRSLGVGEWVRRLLGVAVLSGVAVIALGLDTGILTRVSLGTTAALEQHILDRFGPSIATNRQPLPDSPAGGASSGEAVSPTLASPAGVPALPVEGELPSLDGAVAWVNSPPLSAKDLRGKVVLIDFWTYSCINCLRTLPYLRAWAEKYKEQGLVVIGVHAPEFAFEKDLDNVRRAIKDLGITYPVAIDNDYAIWRAFNNEYWPAHYFVDGQGRIRFHHFGEGEYAQSERVIRQLLSENGSAPPGNELAVVNGTGVSQAADDADVQSPETYVGYERAEHFASPGGELHDAPRDYAAPRSLALNEWALVGSWDVHEQTADLMGASGGIRFRFHARDLHLVLGPAPGGRSVRFRVSLDGKAPEASHGMDVDASGAGTVTAQRLYQLIRQSGDVREHTFEIEFLDPGVQAFAFTFG